MQNALSTLKALIVGDASIKYAGRMYIKRTPGDTTQLGHN